MWMSHLPPCLFRRSCNRFPHLQSRPLGSNQRFSAHSYARVNTNEFPTGVGANQYSTRDSALDIG